MNQVDGFSNEGRDSEECRRASVAALLGPMLWLRNLLRVMAGPILRPHKRRHQS